MNISQYARSRGRSAAAVWNLCNRYNLGKVGYENGGIQRILSDEDVKELDMRWRKPDVAKR